MNRWFRLNQLWQLTSALFREIIREPGVLFWGILFPILMSLGLGIAFTKKADIIRKVAVILPAQKEDHKEGQTGLTDFLSKYCESNQAEGRDTYQWKLAIKDDKLGNSVFFLL